MAIDAGLSVTLDLPARLSGFTVVEADSSHIRSAKKTPLGRKGEQRGADQDAQHLARSGAWILGA
jgi:hypothetical protein